MSIIILCKKNRFKVWLDRRGGFKSSVTRKKLRPLISPPSCASPQYSPESQKIFNFLQKISSKFQSHKKNPCYSQFSLQFSPNHKELFPVLHNAPIIFSLSSDIISSSQTNNNNDNNSHAGDQGRCKIGLSLDSKQILHFNGFLLPILTLETLF